MEEKKIEIVTYKTQYVAKDGTTFDSKIECERYESTARCVISERFFQSCVNPDNCKRICDVFSGGIDGRIYAINLTEDNINDVMMFFKCNGTNFEKLSNKIGKKILVFTNYDEDCYWWESLDDVINNFSNLFIKNE